MLNTIMDPIRNSSHVSIKHCSLCPGTTEYYCHDCKGDLCRPCKEMHVDILDIKRHNVTLYRGKFNNVPRNEHCTEHPDEVIEMHCEQCDIPVCFHCRKHQQHKLENIRTAYENQGMQTNDIIINISYETIYNKQVLLRELKSDFAACYKEIDQLKTAMFIKSKRLKDILDNLQSEISLKYKTLLVCRLLRQRIKLKRYIGKVQKLESKYAKSGFRLVQFLQFIKNASFPRLQDSPRFTQHYLLSLTQEINMEELINLLSEINITESGKQRQAGNEFLPTLMPSPVLQKSISVAGVQRCLHISYVTPDRVWVSDHDNTILQLIDTATGDILYSLRDTLVSYTGNHSVNRDKEFIYIDNHYYIKKLSTDIKITTFLIDSSDPAWKPKCVYCSPSSGNLLVGMLTNDRYLHRGKVMRYNNTLLHTQTIPHNYTTDNLYRFPYFITENNNGDVVVSDLGRVVVTSGDGVHRFNYAGLIPSGVCTDVLSHILVSDAKSHTVHMLSQDGEFLRYILTQHSLEIDGCIPYCLGYDPDTHSLWVGSWLDNKMFVYRHISRHPAILDLSG